jgi:hypothetical protein
MKLNRLAWCAALGALAIPAAITTAASAALAAHDPAAHDPGAVRHGATAAGGAELWRARYGRPGNSLGYPSSLAVSPDGTRVFVTGGATGPNRQPEINYTTLAYSS